MMAKDERRERGRTVRAVRAKVIVSTLRTSRCRIASCTHTCALSITVAVGITGRCCVAI